jgi:hypothetical protein
MLKYIFITHVQHIEVASDDYQSTFHCNYYKRVDDILEGFTVSQLSDEAPSKECKELADTITQLGCVSRFNPLKNYKMSTVIFTDDQIGIVDDLLIQMDNQCQSTIKMIRKSPDTQPL